MKQYALVVGIGKTGLSIAHYLQHKGLPFAVYDTRAAPSGIDVLRKHYPHVTCYLGAIPDTILAEIDTIYMSPGVSLELPIIQRALNAQIPVIGDVECLAQEIRSPVIAITGTNGKSTVTTLVGDMACRSGISTAMGGNLGMPVLDLLLDAKNYDLWVLELSSFQLELTYTLTPLAATVLNITPDHLDRHHSLTAYAAAKHRIYHSAKTTIYNRDDPSTCPSPSTSPVKVSSFGLDTPEEGQWGIIDKGLLAIAFGNEIILPVTELKVKGRHNWANAVAACALAHAAGIDFDVMRSVLRDFPGLSHRTAHVRQLDGVDWIDDSKGTNVGATCSAITGIGTAIAGKLVLIVGGQGKGADFRILQQAVSQYVRALVIFGEDAKTIEGALAQLVDTTVVSDLKTAVEVARKKAVSGDVVLLSPACASFDMFRDFNHRGEVFNDLVCALGSS